VEGLDLAVARGERLNFQNLFVRSRVVHYFTCTFPPTMLPMKKGFSVMP
jgi:hypothetical protein